VVLNQWRLAPRLQPLLTQEPEQTQRRRCQGVGGGHQLRQHGRARALLLLILLLEDLQVCLCQRQLLRHLEH
jgi:hypothetical protein